MYDQRVENAEELLGSRYQKSVVRGTEKIQKINGSVYRMTKASLPKDYKHDYKKIAQAIIDEAHRNSFDPVLLMAMIQSESSFNPRQLGHAGEIGLMQHKPSTAQWMARVSCLHWSGAESLFNPLVNIQLGAAYLNYLRGKFDSHAQLYLAAYNRGSSRARGSLEKKIWPKEYPAHVMKHYIAYYRELRDKSRRPATNSTSL